MRRSLATSCTFRQLLAKLATQWLLVEMAQAPTSGQIGPRSSIIRQRVMVLTHSGGVVDLTVALLISKFGSVRSKVLRSFTTRPALVNRPG
jgi:hypothetical protein